MCVASFGMAKSTNEMARKKTRSAEVENSVSSVWLIEGASRIFSNEKIRCVQEETVVAAYIRFLGYQIEQKKNY